MRALLILVLTLVVVPAPAAMAAPPLPTVSLTLTSVTSPVAYGADAWYYATISPVPTAGSVVFEASYDDGLTWPETVASVGYWLFGAGEVSWGLQVTPSVPTGTRLIRARFSDPLGESGFAGAVSSTLSQTVTKSTPSLFGFEVFDDFHRSLILPGTTPVKLYVEKSGSSPSSVSFEEHVADAWQLLGTAPFQTDFINPPYAVLQLDGFAEGTHELRARLESTDATNEATTTLTLEVAKGVATVEVSGPTTVEANHAFALNAGTNGEGLGRTGTLTLYEGATVIATSTDDNPAIFDAPVPGRGVGTYTFHAVYSGDSSFEPATSPDFVVTVTADTVSATGVGIQYSTFYPVKDGYRDTVAFRGTRNEAISVTANVYNSTGTRVKTLTAARGTGAYALTWTGRNSSGTILASGKYKVVQTLKDAAGTTKTYTGYVTLSRKQLVTYTKSISKTGYHYDAKGKGGTGTISTSSTSGWIKLRGGSSGYAIAGWELQLPSATIYKSMSFKLYAKSAFAVPGNFMAVQNFSTCSRSTTTAWNDSCFERWTTVANSGNSLAWYSAKASVTSNRSGRYVRILADSEYSTLYVYQARVTVTYQVLQ